MEEKEEELAGSYCRVNLHESGGQPLYVTVYGETWDETKDRSERAGVYNPDSENYKSIEIEFSEIVIIRYYYNSVWWPAGIYGKDLAGILDFCNDNNLHVVQAACVLPNRWAEFKFVWSQRLFKACYYVRLFFAWAGNYLSELWSFIKRL